MLFRRPGKIAVELFVKMTPPPSLEVPPNVEAK
jgi:hypothetical protein